MISLSKSGLIPAGEEAVVRFGWRIDRKPRSYAAMWIIFLLFFYRHLLKLELQAGTQAHLVILYLIKL